MTAKNYSDKTKLRKLLRNIIIAFIVILAGQLIFKIFVVPNIVLQKIKVESEVSLSDSEILTIAGIDAGEYYYNVSPEDIKQRLEMYPEVRKASVEKVFPDKLKLYLFARKAVALVVLNIDEKSIPVAIDNEGVIYSRGIDLLSWDLPVITGIRFSALELGAQLPAPLLPLLDDLKNLKDDNPALYNLLSEIKVERRGERGYDLILFLHSYPVRARIGNELDGNVLKNIIMVFEVLNKQKLTDKIGEVDFRTKEIIYRLREEV
ncbi:MAG: FtsQ-type POTRA domain-containing protein [Spirochaetaceae bacterium]|jgi:cell division protein FtsQ|nr:FtsQ-type POTRA domain-containing protein [Spirochaetaceae bacterium]